MYVVELAMLLRLESLSVCAEIFGLLGEFILTKNKEYLFSYLPQLRNLAAQAVLRCSHKSRCVNNGGWCSTLLANEWRCCRQITWRCQRRWTCSEARCAYRPFRFDPEFDASVVQYLEKGINVHAFVAPSIWPSLQRRCRCTKTALTNATKVRESHTQTTPGWFSGSCRESRSVSNDWERKMTTISHEQFPAPAKGSQRRHALQCGCRPWTNVLHEELTVSFNDWERLLYCVSATYLLIYYC